MNSRNKLDKPSTTANICIIGPSGAGKSTLANNLMGLKAFATSDTPSKSCTQSVQSNKLCLNEKLYTIIDTPGFFDTDKANDMTIISEITKELNKFEYINLFVWCINGH